MPRQPRQNAFRLKGVKFLLTFPHCPTPKEWLKDHLIDKHSPVYLRVCEEAHQDGSPHLHVYIHFSRTKDFSSPRCFDFTHEAIVYHGNYQVARSVAAAVAYVSKTDNWVEHGQLPAERKKSDKDSDEIYRAVLAAETREAALAIIREQAPRDAIIYANQISSFLDKNFMSFEEYVPAFPDFPNVPGPCLEWVSGNLLVSLTPVHTEALI